MTLEELKIELIKVEETFGKSYGSHQLTILDEFFGHYSPARWKAICKEMISSKKFLPTINEFKEADLEIKVSDYYKAKENQSSLINSHWLDSPPIKVKEIKDSIGNLLEQMKVDAKKNEAMWRENHLKGAYINNTRLVTQE